MSLYRRSGYWSTYHHNNDIFHREGSSWTKHTNLHSRLSKIATDVNFAPMATSIPTSIITRPTSIPLPQRPLQKLTPLLQPPAVHKTESQPLPSWETVLTGQPFWAQKLLQHFYFDTIANILKPITKKVPLYVVSNGSATDKQTTMESQHDKRTAIGKQSRKLCRPAKLSLSGS